MIGFSLFRVVGIAVFLLLIAIGVVRHNLPIDINFQHDLVSTIIGSGILGIFVAALFFYFDKEGDDRRQRREAQAFVTGELTYDIREIEDRPKQVWIPGTANRFYFGNSRLMHYYDVLNKHAKTIHRYLEILGQNKILIVSVELYNGLRKALTLAENIDIYFAHAVTQKHRTEQQPRQLDRAILEYLKIKIYTELKDEEFIREIGLVSIPPYVKKLVFNLNEDAEMNSYISQLREKRIELERLSEQLRANT